MWKLLEPKELVQVNDEFESGMGDKVRWTKYDKGMSAIGKPCGEFRIVRRKISDTVESPDSAKEQQPCGENNTTKVEIMRQIELTLRDIVQQH